MKKYIFAALVTAAALTITGCSSGKESSADESSSTVSESTASAADSGSAASTAEDSAAESGSAASTAEDSAAESGSATSTAEDSAPADGEQAAGDLEEVYNKIMAVQTTPDDIIMFPETNEDYVNGLYPGLLDLDIKNMVFYVPPVTGNACEILLLEAADSNSADKAEKIMQDRVDSAASDTIYPDVAEVWARNAKVERSGNKLCMIVLPDSAVVPDDVFAL